MTVTVITEHCRRSGRAQDSVTAPRLMITEHRAGAGGCRVTSVLDSVKRIPPGRPGCGSRGRGLRLVEGSPCSRRRVSGFRRIDRARTRQSSWTRKCSSRHPETLHDHDDNPPANDNPPPGTRKSSRKRRPSRPDDGNHPAHGSVPYSSAARRRASTSAMSPAGASFCQALAVRTWASGAGGAWTMGGARCDLGGLGESPARSNSCSLGWLGRAALVPGLRERHCGVCGTTVFAALRCLRHCASCSGETVSGGA